MNEKNKNNAFKTPEGYFDNLAERIADRLEERNEDLPNFNLDHEKGFKVPEGYFENLKDAILKKQNGGEAKVVKLHPYRKFYIAAASIAAITLLLLAFPWNTKENLAFEDLASTEIEDYFEENELELSSYEIAEVLSVEELEVNDILDTELNQENIIDYLDEHVDDFDELNIESDE